MSQSIANANRRRTRRQSSKKSTKIACHKGANALGPNLARRLLDVSTDGACLVIASPLENGQEITLGLEGLWHARPIKVHANVRWCTPLDDGAYCVGVHFQRTLPYNEVLTLASHG